jgi:hypothetical protein
LAVGFGSVHAALSGQPWAYVPLWIGQYINLLGLPFFIGTVSGTILALPSRKERRRGDNRRSLIRGNETG